MLDKLIDNMLAAKTLEAYKEASSAFYDYTATNGISSVSIDRNSDWSNGMRKVTYTAIGEPKPIEAPLEPEEEITLEAPTEIEDDATPTVLIDSNGEITLFMEDGNGYDLTKEEAEKLVERLSWALDGISSLNDRVPF